MVDFCCDFTYAFFCRWNVKDWKFLNVIGLCYLVTTPIKNVPNKISSKVA